MSILFTANFLCALSLAGEPALKRKNLFISVIIIGDVQANIMINQCSKIMQNEQ